MNRRTLLAGIAAAVLLPTRAVAGIRSPYAAAETHSLNVCWLTKFECRASRWLRWRIAFYDADDRAISRTNRAGTVCVPDGAERAELTLLSGLRGASFQYDQSPANARDPAIRALWARPIKP